MKNPLTKIRDQYLNNYDPILWIIVIFFASSINSLLLHAPISTLVDQLNQIHTSGVQKTPLVHTEILYQIPILFTVIFFLPMAISSITTKLSPSKMIIPPFFIQLVTVGYFLFFLSIYYTNVLTLDTVFVWFFVLGFVGIAGYAQDPILIAIFGRSVKPEDMIQRSFKTRNNFTSIENIIRKDVIRTRLNLDKKIEETHNGIIMRSRNTKFQTVLELVKLNDGNTMINIVCFEKGRYYFQKSDGLIEYERDKTAYLKAVLLDSEDEIKIESDSERNADAIVTSLITENSGMESQVGSISRNGKIKLGSFIGSIVLSIWLVTSNHLGEGIASLAGIALFLAFELPNRLLPKRHHT